MGSPGASRPFFVVADDERDPNENKFFAFGADATLRMNRVAFCPIAFGDKGPDRTAFDGELGANDS